MTLRRALRAVLLAALLAGAAPHAAWAADPPGNPPGRGVRTLILIRHGAYEEDDPREPDVGKALTAEGREQARLTGGRLAGLPLRIDAIHASTMTRARQTGEILAAALKLPLQPSRLIRECTPPTERADIMAREKPEELAACTDTLGQAWTRWFRPSPERDSTEVLVCHGNVIRWLTGRALGLDAMRWLRMSLGNCSLTTIRVRPDGTAQVLGVGDLGHLPNALQQRLWFPAPAAPASARPAGADSLRAR